mgnify:CR=1 FL=1
MCLPLSTILQLNIHMLPTSLMNMDSHLHNNSMQLLDVNMTKCFEWSKKKRASTSLEIWIVDPPNSMKVCLWRLFSSKWNWMHILLRRSFIHRGQQQANQFLTDITLKYIGCQTSSLNSISQKWAKNAFMYTHGLYKSQRYS